MRLYPAAALVLALLALALDGCGTSHPTMHVNFNGAAYPPGIVAPAFRLHDSNGRPVSLGEYRGRVVALTFLSSGCRTCALVAQQIRGALDELGSPAGVSTIFVSTDPRTDTPARVARFLGSASLAGRALYLSGSQRQLQAIWRSYHVTSGEDGITVLLIDRAGVERVGFGIEQITPEGLSHDIRLLLAD
jgi:protein SCO1/2